MRNFLLVALGAMVLLVPGAYSPAYAREQQNLGERVRDGATRTGDDLEKLVHRDKLNQPQRDRFDAAVKDLQELREAVTGGHWEGERGRLEHAVDNIDFVIKNAPLEEGDRQMLGIDLYTLQVILDSWKP